jgi:hypothetical protein
MNEDASWVLERVVEVVHQNPNFFFQLDLLGNHLKRIGEDVLSLLSKLNTTRLRLQYNKLTEVSLLCDLMKLEELSLSDNPLSTEGFVVVSKFLRVSLFGGLLLLLLLVVLWYNSFGLWCLVLVVTAK